MDVSRRPISKFRNMTIAARWPTDEEVERLNLRPGTLVFVVPTTDAIVAQVDAEDLFDADGNRFWLDA